MGLYAAFLRGMNVGGHRITNAELRELFTAMDVEDPRCFRASGNVVFGSAERSPTALAAHIEDVLRSALGYAVPIFLRTREQVQVIAALTPFTERELCASSGRAQVALLSAAPDGRARERIAEMAGKSDRVAFGPLEMHWLPSGGVLDSTLDMAAIERVLGPMTMRTAGTVSELAARHLSG